MMTSRCSCARVRSTRCLVKTAPASPPLSLIHILGDADSLWLKREPSRDELLTMLAEQRLAVYDEIVFCGYGEPTERLDCLFAICDFVKRDEGLKGRLKTRLNTNGLSDLINQRATAKEFAGRLDAISISLNAPTAEQYNELCRPKSVSYTHLDVYKRQPRL